METGLTDSDRVLVICTVEYVAKANAGSGGVGYEKMILTAQLMQDVTTDRIVPVVRDNGPPVVMPTFLGSCAYINFRDDAACKARYAELLRDLHAVQVSLRPALGPNPFRAPPLEHQAPVLSERPERYVAPALAGRVTFDYSNNNGRFVLGAGDMLFETAWSAAGRAAIHAYADPPSIRTVALVTDTRDISAIADASSYDSSSRVRSPHLGEIVVWQNTAGYYAVTKIEGLKARTHGDPYDEVTFSYAIQSNRSPSSVSVTPRRGCIARGRQPARKARSLIRALCR